MIELLVKNVGFIVKIKLKVNLFRGGSHMGHQGMVRTEEQKEQSSIGMSSRIGYPIASDQS